jgi:hypothetical protein
MKGAVCARGIGGASSRAQTRAHVAAVSPAARKIGSTVRLRPSDHHSSCDTRRAQAIEISAGLAAFWPARRRRLPRRIQSISCVWPAGCAISKSQPCRLRLLACLPCPATQCSHCLCALDGGSDEPWSRAKTPLLHGLLSTFGKHPHRPNLAVTFLPQPRGPLQASHSPLPPSTARLTALRAEPVQHTTAGTNAASGIAIGRSAEPPCRPASITYERSATSLRLRSPATPSATLLDSSPPRRLTIRGGSCPSCSH